MAQASLLLEKLQPCSVMGIVGWALAQQLCWLLVESCTGTATVLAVTAGGTILHVPLLSLPAVALLTCADPTHSTWAHVTATDVANGHMLLARLETGRLCLSIVPGHITDAVVATYPRACLICSGPRLGARVLAGLCCCMWRSLGCCAVLLIAIVKWF